jgi:uncharacterized protein
VATEVRDNPAQRRYEAYVDGELAAFSEYGRTGDRVTFVHTRVEPAFEGRGVGSDLVRGALDDVRRRGGQVVARCPFVRAWLQRHPEQQDLLAVPLDA